MEERNGLYYIINITLLPPSKPSVQAMKTIVPIVEVSSDEESDHKKETTSAINDEKLTESSSNTGSDYQIETITETDDEEQNPKEKQSAEECIKENGVFMAPRKPDPPSAPPEKTRKETTPMTVPPETPAPSPPPNVSAKSDTKTGTATAKPNVSQWTDHHNASDQQPQH